MKEDPDLSPDIEAELRQLFAAEAGGTHLTRGQLEALVLGELDEDEQDRLLEQVALDPELTDELLELRRLAAAGQAPAPAERDGVDAVMASIAAASGPTFEAQPRRLTALPDLFRSEWLALAAALVAVASLFFALQARRTNSELQRQLAQLEADAGPPDVQPQDATTGVHANVRLVDLFADSQLRGETGPAMLRASPGEPTVLILTPGDPEPGRVYAVSIQQAGGDLWHGEATAEASGAVVLLLGPGLVVSGPLRIELRPPSGDASIFELVAQPP